MKLPKNLPFSVFGADSRRNMSATTMSFRADPVFLSGADGLCCTNCQDLVYDNSSIPYFLTARRSLFCSLLFETILVCCPLVWCGVFSRAIAADHASSSETLQPTPVLPDLAGNECGEAQRQGCARHRHGQRPGQGLPHQGEISDWDGNEPQHEVAQAL